ASIDCLAELAKLGATYNLRSSFRAPTFAGCWTARTPPRDPRYGRLRCTPTVSMLVAKLGAVYDAGCLALMRGPGLGIAIGKHIATDLSVVVPVSIHEDGMRVPGPRELPDEAFLRPFAHAGNGDDPPEATVFLSRDFESEILLVEPRLLPGPRPRRPMAAA